MGGREGTLVLGIHKRQTPLHQPDYIMYISVDKHIFVKINTLMISSFQTLTHFL